MGGLRDVYRIGYRYELVKSTVDVVVVVVCHEVEKYQWSPCIARPGWIVACFTCRRFESMRLGVKQRGNTGLRTIRLCNTGLRTAMGLML